MQSNQKKRSVRYGLGILLLSLIFCARVVTQFLQWLKPVDYLPAFDQWHSGALPYFILLLCQIAILLLLLRLIWLLFVQRLAQQPRRGRWYLIIGGLYASVMLFRLYAGFTFAVDHPWLGAKIPAFFHLCLATILLLVGRYHCAGQGK